MCFVFYLAQFLNCKLHQKKIALRFKIKKHCFTRHFVRVENPLQLKENLKIKLNSNSQFGRKQQTEVINDKTATAMAKFG